MIFNKEIRDTAEHDSKVVEFKWRTIALFYWKNTLDQDITAVFKGSPDNKEWFGIATKTLTTGGKGFYSISDPHPYLKVTVSASIAPTIGRLTIWSEEK